MRESLLVFCDGACGPDNPHGNVGIGLVFYHCVNLVLKNRDTREIKSTFDSVRKIKTISLGWEFGKNGLYETSNNLAEHMAVNEALNDILNNYSHYEKIYIMSDSEMTVKQMNGKYKINPGSIYYQKAKENFSLLIDMQEAEFNLEFIWIPRNLNVADEPSKKTIASFKE
jgi:ribonuclease HI